MADAKGLQELLGYFVTGAEPSEAQFAALFNSIQKVINVAFDDTDVSAEGDLVVTYPDSVVAGVSVDTEITRPLYAVVTGSTGESVGPYPVTYLTKNTCTVHIGSKLPSGSYSLTIFYQF
jgi:hypothetical protein